MTVVAARRVLPCQLTAGGWAILVAAAAWLNIAYGVYELCAVAARMSWLITTVTHRLLGLFMARSGHISNRRRNRKLLATVAKEPPLRKHDLLSDEVR